MNSASRRKIEKALGRISDDDVIEALDHEMRETQINVRVSFNQHAQIREVSSALDLSISEYLLTLHALAVPRLRAAVKATKRK